MCHAMIAAAVPTSAQCGREIKYTEAFIPVRMSTLLQFNVDCQRAVSIRDSRRGPIPINNAWSCRKLSFGVTRVDDGFVPAQSLGSLAAETSEE